MKRNEADKKYQWDFSALYADHAAWKKDLEVVVNKINEVITFKGKLNQFEVFKRYLEIDEELELIITKMGQYLHYGDLDTTNLEYQELGGIFGNTVNELSSKLAFISPELKAIGETTVLGWLHNDPALNKYEYTYRKFFEHAKYVLSERDEEILSIVSRSRNAAYEMYDLLAYADKKPVYIEFEGEKQELTNSLYTKIMEETDPHRDQQLRIQAADLFTEQLEEKKHSLAKVYETILIKSVESVKLRKYKNTLEASLLGDDVSEEIYESLIKFGLQHSNLFVEYNKILKNHFKFDKFYSTDRSLKIVKTLARSYTVEEGKDMIREALKVLGPKYLEKLEIAWGPNRIDYYEDTNKRDGAYSSGGGGVDPIILMNWDDKINSVNTLAHEAGHSVHTLFADEAQAYPLSNYPILLAEVASTMNEHLLFDYLYEGAQSDDERINLLQNRIDEIMGTFFRQIHFADFEWRAHQMVEKGQPLNADILADLFAQKSQDYGYSVFDKIDNKKPYGWTRILHFFNSPYYVYKYATSIVASFKLYQDVKSGNVDNLLNFLKAGGHKEPLLILKDAGIDFTQADVYEPLINKLKAMISELSTLLVKKNKISKN